MTTTFNICCAPDVLERINKRFPPGHKGSHQRSAFIVKAVTEELDRLDQEELGREQTQRWLDEKVIPALRKLLKKCDFGDVVNHLKNKSSRVKLISQLSEAGITVTDNDLVLAIHGVLKDYD